MEWRHLWPEASIGASVVALLLRLRWRSVIGAKNRLFDLGAVLIELQTCEADRRALEKALARTRAMEELLDHAGSPASPTGSGAAGTAPSPNGAKPRPRIRSLSRRSGRTKRAASPTRATDR